MKIFHLLVCTLKVKSSKFMLRFVCDVHQNIVFCSLDLNVSSERRTLTLLRLNTTFSKQLCSWAWTQRNAVSLIFSRETRSQGRQSWGLWGPRPPEFGQGLSWGVAGVVVGGREILLQLIMYRKYVRKWWLLKINRTICPGAAENDKFLPGKSKFSVKLPEKSKYFENLPGKKIYFIVWNCRKKRNFLKICLEKSKSFYPNPRPPDFKLDWRRFTFPTIFNSSVKV